MSLFKSLFSSNKSEKDFGIELFRALYEPNKQKVIEIIEKEKIGINEYLISSNSSSILINAVNCSPEFQDSNEQIELIDYLIDQKADVNWKNNNGFNSLHIALAYHSLSKISLLLLRKGNPDVNIVEDKHGNSPIFTAIREYGLTWREEQKEVNQLRFEIINELLNRGAKLDKINNHGISARKWIERVSKKDKLHNLINEFDKK
ncbi:ankyrin repeat domain-containing protein [Pseudofulvibacter geojedonensis]|uniref:Ankyrin repeat domain-containing protein n=1 Tax=Pseudofulvibacter geojedonensis TaxID=1123758 RepID=A0ABW3I1X8_9FLAO